MDQFSFRRVFSGYAYLIHALAFPSHAMSLFVPHPFIFLLYNIIFESTSSDHFVHLQKKKIIKMVPVTLTCSLEIGIQGLGWSVHCRVSLVLQATVCYPSGPAIIG